MIALCHLALTHRFVVSTCRTVSDSVTYRQKSLSLYADTIAQHHVTSQTDSPFIVP